MRAFGIVAISLLVCSAPAAAGCSGEKEAAPVTAARAFAQAMVRADANALIDLVDLDAAARLEHAASQASDQVGGRRTIEQYEMIQVVDVPDSFQVAKAELVSGDDTEASVALVAADGERHVVQMVFQEGAWRVRVPLPPLHEDTP